MIGMGTRVTILLAIGSAIFAFGIIAVSQSWWQSAAVTGLTLLWLILVVFSYQQKRIAKSVSALHKRTKSIEEGVSAVRDSERRTRKRTLGRHLDLIRGAISARLDGIEANVGTATRNLEATARAMSELIPADPVDKLALDKAVSRIEGSARSIRDANPSPSENRPHHELITQIDAMLQLRKRFPLDGPAPLMWGWALSPRGLLQVVDLATQGCDLVVECGSGTSTIYLGRALRDIGRGRLVAIEHLAEIAERVRADVRRHGLEDVVEVRVAELVDHQVGETAYLWYDAQRLDDLENIDLLLVDGPPSTTGELARLPALNVLGPQLRSGATVVLDDAQRADERQIAQDWLSDVRLNQVRSRTRDQYVFRWVTAPESERAVDTHVEDPP